MNGLFETFKSISFSDVKELLKKFRIIIVLYFIAVITYIVIFGILQAYTYNVMGRDFAISFSASFLEDLIFFLFIGFVVSLISIIASQKAPEDYDFDRRVGAMVNSDLAKNDVFIKSFLVNSMNKTLIFYSRFELVMTLDNYDKNTKSYMIYLQREQIFSNMCRDREYSISNHTISIEADHEVNGLYGQITYCHTYDPKTNSVIHKDCDETDKISLSKGINHRTFPMVVLPNSSCGVRFGYNAWQKTGDKDDRSNWIYFQSARLVTDMTIKVKNKLESKNPVKYEIRVSKSVDSKFSDIKEGELFYGSESSILRSDIIRLTPGDRFEIYLYPSE